MADLLTSRRGRLATFGALYLSEGLPQGFATVELALEFKRRGMDAAAIDAAAIDALACSVLKPDERGLANGVMFGSAQAGQAVGGAGVLMLKGSSEASRWRVCWSRPCCL